MLIIIKTGFKIIKWNAKDRKKNLHYIKFSWNFLKSKKFLQKILKKKIFFVRNLIEAQ